MAEGNQPRPPSYKVKTFTVDCNTQSTMSGFGYTGQKALSNEEQEGASAIIPLWARKSGYGEICTVGFEYGAIRLSSSVSWTNVTVGLLYLYL